MLLMGIAGVVSFAAYRRRWKKSAAEKSATPA
ncbi:MAG: hypothetical protein KDA85_15640 [Planctomycetaceae bacterium]|nr:hypothetical protein [Planctomycetaceae bacterium]